MTGPDRASWTDANGATWTQLEGSEGIATELGADSAMRWRVGDVIYGLHEWGRVTDPAADAARAGGWSTAEEADYAIGLLVEDAKERKANRGLGDEQW